MKSLKAHTFALVAALAVLLLVAMGGTAAYLYSTSKVANTFTLATMNVDITEDFDGTVKKNVAITNTADTPVYIRATLLFAWKDNAGRVLAEVPQKDTDYTLVPGPQTDWVKGADGYYYYTKAVAQGEKTTNLLDSLEKKTSPEGKTLSATIVAQAVQANPKEAVSDLWGATVDEATLVLTPRREVAP